MVDRLAHFVRFSEKLVVFVHISHFNISDMGFLCVTKGPICLEMRLLSYIPAFASHHVTYFLRKSVRLLAELFAVTQKSRLIEPGFKTLIRKYVLLPKSVCSLHLIP